MEAKLVLEEKYSSWWAEVTIGLGLSALLLFVIFSLVDDVLWKGILRLGSFGFLAAAVFSGLKVMEGKHSITLAVKNGHLIVSYRKRGHNVGEDIFELDNITSVYVDNLSSEFFPQNLFTVSEQQVVLELEDSDRPLTLAEVGGRTLALSQQSARVAVKFISGHAPGITIPDRYKEKRDDSSGSG